MLDVTTVYKKAYIFYIYTDFVWIYYILYNIIWILYELCIKYYINIWIYYDIMILCVS